MLSNKTLFVGTMLGEVNPKVLDKKDLKIEVGQHYKHFWLSPTFGFPTLRKNSLCFYLKLLQDLEHCWLRTWWKKSSQLFCKKNDSEYQDWPIIGRLWHFRLSRFQSQLENHLFGKSFSSEWCSAVACMERISRVFQERYESECP